MRKKSLIRFGVALLSATLLVMFIINGSASAETFKLIAGGGAPADVWPPMKVLRDFWCAEVKKQVESKTSHKIEWTFAFGTLTKPQEDFEAVQRGILHVGNPLPVLEPTKLFAHNYAYWAPFGPSDHKLATKVNIEVYNKIPYLRQTYEKYNQKWLGVFTYENYDMVSKFPFKTLGDLKGHKIACVGINCPWLKNIGVVPVQSIFPDAYTSLQTGVYDGFLMMLSSVNSFKLYEVAKHYTYVGLGCMAGGSVTVNMKIWKSLPKEVQDIMIEVGREYPYAVSREYEIRRAKAMEAIEKTDLQFHTLPLKDKREWMKFLGDLADEKAKEADKMGFPGSEVVKYYVEAAARAGHEWPIKWEIK